MKKKQNRLIIWAAKGMFPSARKLADALKPETDRRVLIVRSDSPRFKQRGSDEVINWGNSKEPQWDDPLMAAPLNNPENVSISVNKLKTFQALTGRVRIPDWTTDRDQAKDWWEAGHIVLHRSILNGYGGNGITIYQKGTKSDKYHMGFGFPLEGTLFVLYKKKKAEYRVHVFNGEVIDITQKKKRAGFEDVNTKIRNYANGWVYCREDIEVPDDVREQAIKAVRHLGLDFGAVDVIYNAKEDQAYVLEVNSAPGLEGQTIESYKQAILTTLQN